MQLKIRVVAMLGLSSVRLCNDNVGMMRLKIYIVTTVMQLKIRVVAMLGCCCIKQRESWSDAVTNVANTDCMA